MKILTRLLILFIGFISISQSLADENNCCDFDSGIIYVDNWAFLINTPSGWSMSTNNPDLSVNVAFFQTKIDTNTDNPPAFMYITVTKKSTGVPNISQNIAI